MARTWGGTHRCGGGAGNLRERATDDAGRSLSEVAKAAIGLIPLAVFGGIIASLVRARDERRTEDQRVDTYRREFYAELIGAYNGVKTSRRNLRAAGLKEPWAGNPSDDQLKKLDVEMAALSTTQLTLEKLRRQMAAPGVTFDEEDSITKDLLVLEQRINDVVKDWESHRVALSGASSGSRSPWTDYAWFTADNPDGNRGDRGEKGEEADDATEGEGFATVSHAMHRIERTVNKQLNEARGRTRH